MPRCGPTTLLAPPRSRGVEESSGAARLSRSDRGLARCQYRQRVPPPSPTQAQQEFCPPIGRIAAERRQSRRIQIPAPCGTLCTCGTGLSSPRLLRLPLHRVACPRSELLTSRPPHSLSNALPPASRRLSRSPSAPERTINVLHRRRRGRTGVLSGAEAARRSHYRLAGRRLPAPCFARRALPAALRFS